MTRMEDNNQQCPGLSYQPSVHNQMLEPSAIHGYLPALTDPSTLVVNDFTMDGMGLSCWGGRSSDIEGTGSSEVAEFLNSEGDSVISRGTGSFENVYHNRTSSNESRRTFFSEGLCLSTPSEGAPDCHYATSYSGEQLMGRPVPSNQALLLQDLAIAQAIYHSSQATRSGNEDMAYLDNTVINPLDQIQTSGQPFSMSEDSWNPYQLRVPDYTPGFTAFAPLTPPQNVLDGPSSSPSKPPSASRSRTSSKQKRPVRASPKSAKGKEISWQHTVVMKGGFQKVLDVDETEPSQRNRAFGIRKGPLDPEAKEKARIVRQRGACWACWVVKTGCDKDNVCKRCRSLFSKCSPSADQMCSRSGFVDYEELFFPEYLHSHLARQCIEELINEHIYRFTDTGFEVEVSTGASFPPMQLFANIFVPKTDILLKVHQQHGDRPHFTSRFSAPIGLMALSTTVLKKQCREHIEKMIEDPEYGLQTTSGDSESTKIPFLVLTAIRNYYNVTDSPLLHSAMALHACHYFMRKLVTFSNASALKLHQIMEQSGAPLKPFLSSRLLNRQLKYVMHKLHREITREVLVGLERSMRQRTKDSWGPSLCAILLLCICIEDLQTAAETFVVCDIQKAAEDGLGSAYSREQSLTACQNLDSYPFQQCTRLFHDIYRSHKEAGGAREGGLNPFRSLDLGEETALDKETDAMVHELHWVIRDSYAELTKLSMKPAGLDIPISRRTGRLVAKFLSSFLPPRQLSHDV